MNLLPHKGSPELGLLLKAKTRASQVEFYTRLFKRPWDSVQINRINKRIDNYAKNAKNEFFVIQIGANDGIQTDPIRQFIYRYKWHGILVEPVPWYLNTLKETYKDCMNLRYVQAAITKEDGEATLYATIELKDGQLNPLQGKDSLIQNMVEDRAWMSSWPLSRLVRPIKVRTMCLSTLFEKESVNKIDMFVTDAEGYDKVILDQIDFKRFKPHFILYEHLNMPSEDKISIKKRLKTEGYKTVSSRRDTLAIST
jgi:FkbM family methyltransferase